MTKNLLGKKFTRLSVQNLVGTKKVGSKSYKLWECKCDCGNIIQLTTTALTSNNTKSCGCLQKDLVRKRTQSKFKKGQRFGRLKINQSIGCTNGEQRWKCTCDCGNIINVDSYSLNSGHTKSCGCFKRDRASEVNCRKIKGQKFGKLKAIQDIGKKGKLRLWQCECDCGNIIETTSSCLIGGHTKSCGCFRGERILEVLGAKLQGNRYGRLIVIKYVRSDKNRQIWQCQCDCGNLTEASTNQLTMYTKQSCGCLKIERLLSLNHSKKGTNNLNVRRNIESSKFGRLTAIRDVGKTDTGKRLWECRCDCGKICNIPSNCLLNGNTQSCGCYKKDKMSEILKHDLKGQKFSKLLVIKSSGSNNFGKQIHECLCECGKTCYVTTGALNSKNTKSCGCLQIETVKFRGWEHADENCDFNFIVNQILGMKKDACYKEALKCDQNL